MARKLIIRDIDIDEDEYIDCYVHNDKKKTCRQVFLELIDPERVKFGYPEEGDKIFDHDEKTIKEVLYKAPNEQYKQYIVIMSFPEIKKKIKKIDIKKFREDGFLQRVNKQFFHPLGLVLEVITEDGTEKLSGIWDYREGKWEEIKNDPHMGHI